MSEWESFIPRLNDETSKRCENVSAQVVKNRIETTSTLQLKLNVISII